jgi:thiamine kinase-like enzyme
MQNRPSDKIDLPEWTDQLALQFKSAKVVYCNAYCAIFSATYKKAGETKSAIVKRYKPESTELARTESQSLDFYSQTIADMPEFMPSRSLAFCEQTNLIAIEYVPGVRFTEATYKSIARPARTKQVVRFCHSLGRLLSRFHEQTEQKSTPLSPMLDDYIRFTGRRLESLPKIGQSNFADAEAEGAQLFLEAAEASQDLGYFCHGDMVFRNIHIQGDKLGIIDWANTNRASHILNDLYNFYFAACNMWIPNRMRQTMIDAISDGLGPISFAPALHRFYYEYHRRRWLMLKLTGPKPWHRFQAWRAMNSFARPYDSLFTPPFIKHIESSTPKTEASYPEQKTALT